MTRILIAFIALVALAAPAHAATAVGTLQVSFTVVDKDETPETEVFFIRTGRAAPATSPEPKPAPR